jgi:hypothetical protein
MAVFSPEYILCAGYATRSEVSQMKDRAASLSGNPETIMLNSGNSTLAERLEMLNTAETILGPYKTLEEALAAWRLMYGRSEGSA